MSEKSLNGEAGNGGDRRNISPLPFRLAIATLVGQIILVVTGGAVRLTASGLGCPRWPKCSSESFVYTPEMGIHGIIEFGNRTLTFVLAMSALALVISLWRYRRSRPDLWWLGWSQIGIIIAQAVIGGITVLTHLNPWIVGVHLLISMLMIIIGVVLVNRIRLLKTGDVVPASSRYRLLIAAIGVCAALAVLIGIMVTGSGPHSGAPNAARNGLDPAIITKIHVLPVYLLVLLTVIYLYFSRSSAASPRLKRAVVILFAIELVQAAIGYIQHFTGLPIALVNLHMLGAALLTASTTNAVHLSRGFRLGRAVIEPAQLVDEAGQPA